MSMHRNQAESWIEVTAKVYKPKKPSASNRIKVTQMSSVTPKLQEVKLQSSDRANNKKGVKITPAAIDLTHTDYPLHFPSCGGQILIQKDQPSHAFKQTRWSIDEEAVCEQKDFLLKVISSSTSTTDEVESGRGMTAPKDNNSLILEVAKEQEMSILVNDVSKVGKRKYKKTTLQTSFNF